MSGWIQSYAQSVVSGLTGLFVAAAIALVCYSLASPPSASGAIRPQSRGPEVALDKTRRDFGEVFLGEALSEVFTVRNVGTAPLELAEKTAAPKSSGSAASLNFRATNFRATAAGLRPVVLRLVPS